MANRSVIIGVVQMVGATVVAPTVMSAQGANRPVSAVEERVIDVRTGEFGLAHVRAVLPTRAGMALISVAPRGFDLRTIDSTGRTRWVRSFVNRQSPLGLAIAGDTIAVTTGTSVDAQVLLFVEGREAPVRVVDIAAERGKVVELLPSLAGSFLVRIEFANEPDGNYLNALRYPQHEVFAVDKAGLRSVFRWVDSAPRILAPTRIPDATGSMSVQPPWVHVPTFAAVNGNVIFAAGNEYRLEVRNRNGAASSFGRREAESELTSDERRRWADEWRASPRGRVWSDSIAAAVLAIPVPKVQPSVRRIFASAGGFAVERGASLRQRSASDSVHVDFFTQSGSYTGSASLAPDVQLQSFTGTHLIATRISTESSGIVRESFALPLTRIVIFRVH